jgi:hypothetical protein
MAPITVLHFGIGSANRLGREGEVRGERQSQENIIVYIHRLSKYVRWRMREEKSEREEGRVERRGFTCISHGA